LRGAGLFGCRKYSFLRLQNAAKWRKDVLFRIFLFCQRFKKQGSVPFFSFIFRFVKRFQLFICFFEAFSAFSLLSNPQKCFIIIKRSAAISRPVCKNGNPGSSQSVLAARPLCGVAGRSRLFQIL
jgi:hypothetical protein